ncbi:MAG TPA: tetratricopeptide repeat protein, partial [Spirochaetales bacterium]|nr:tetratricopeptide repeat protein [Spirochaetales bacterium]
ARDTYVELIKLNPSSWDAMYELGKLYITMGDKENAKKVLTELLAKNPDYAKKSEVQSILSSLK